MGKSPVFFDKKFNPKEVRRLVENKHLVIIKNYLPNSSLLSVRQELAEWQCRDGLSESKNFHLPLTGNDSDKTILKLDYDETTAINAYNFRVGDASQLGNKFPVTRKLFPFLLETFYLVTGKRHFLHGYQEEKNLYLEFVHFPLGAGYVERHNHQSIVDFGLSINMLGLLSSKGVDYAEGGPLYYIENDIYDLRDCFQGGDLLFFHNSIPHEVERIQGPTKEKSPISGRWIYTFFYY